MNTELIKELTGSIAYKKEELARNLRNFGEDLITLANRVENNPKVHLNSLGEVQGRGGQIDAACGTICALISVLEKLENK